MTIPSSFFQSAAAYSVHLADRSRETFAEGASDVPTFERICRETLTLFQLPEVEYDFFTKWIHSIPTRLAVGPGFFCNPGRLFDDLTEKQRSNLRFSYLAQALRLKYKIERTADLLQRLRRIAQAWQHLRQNGKNIDFRRALSMLRADLSSEDVSLLLDFTFILGYGHIKSTYLQWRADEIDTHYIASFLLSTTTGIRGLDQILGGFGLPFGDFGETVEQLEKESLRTPTTVCVRGPFASGKTSLALQIASTYAELGGSVLYCTLEQTAEDLNYMMYSFSEQLNTSGISIVTPSTAVVDPEHDKCARRIVIGSPEGESVDAVLASASDLVSRWLWGPKKLLVIDSLSALPLAQTGTPNDFAIARGYLFRELDKIRIQYNLNTILISEEADALIGEAVAVLADTVISLDRSVETTGYFRTLEVQKSRFQRAALGKHYFDIRPDVGMIVYPTPLAYMRRFKARDTTLVRTAAFRSDLLNAVISEGNEPNVIVIGGTDDMLNRSLALDFLTADDRLFVKPLRSFFSLNGSKTRTGSENAEKSSEDLAEPLNALSNLFAELANSSGTLRDLAKLVIKLDLPAAGKNFQQPLRERGRLAKLFEEDSTLLSNCIASLLLSDDVTQSAHLDALFARFLIEGSIGYDEWKPSFDARAYIPHYASNLRKIMGKLGQPYAVPEIGVVISGVENMNSSFERLARQHSTRPPLIAYLELEQRTDMSSGYFLEAVTAFLARTKETGYSVTKAIFEPGPSGGVLDLLGQGDPLFSAALNDAFLKNAVRPCFVIPGHLSEAIREKGGWQKFVIVNADLVLESESFIRRDQHSRFVKVHTNGFKSGRIVALQVATDREQLSLSYPRGFIRLGSDGSIYETGLVIRIRTSHHRHGKYWTALCADVGRSTSVRIANHEFRLRGEFESGSLTDEAIVQETDEFHSVQVGFSGSEFLRLGKYAKTNYLRTRRREVIKRVFIGSSMRELGKSIERRAVVEQADHRRDQGSWEHIRRLPLYLDFTVLSSEFRNHDVLRSVKSWNSIKERDVILPFQLSSAPTNVEHANALFFEILASCDQGFERDMRLGVPGKRFISLVQDVAKTVGRTEHPDLLGNPFYRAFMIYYHVMPKPREKANMEVTHGWLSESEMKEQHRGGVGLVMPGGFTVSGDRYVSVAEYSPSPAAACGLCEYLSSARESVKRYQMGIGLPVEREFLERLIWTEGRVGWLRDCESDIAMESDVWKELTLGPARGEEVSLPGGLRMLATDILQAVVRPLFRSGVSEYAVLSPILGSFLLALDVQEVRYACFSRGFGTFLGSLESLLGVRIRK